MGALHYRHQLIFRKINTGFGSISVLEISPFALPQTTKHMILIDFPNLKKKKDSCFSGNSVKSLCGHRLCVAHVFLFFFISTHTPYRSVALHEENQLQVYKLLGDTLIDFPFMLLFVMFLLHLSVSLLLLYASLTSWRCVRHAAL